MPDACLGWFVWAQSDKAAPSSISKELLISSKCFSSCIHQALDLLVQVDFIFCAHSQKEMTVDVLDSLFSCHVAGPASKLFLCASKCLLLGSNPTRSSNMLTISALDENSDSEIFVNLIGSQNNSTLM